jgi:hypothetical protein
VPLAGPSAARTRRSRLRGGAVAAVARVVEPVLVPGPERAAAGRERPVRGLARAWAAGYVGAGRGAPREGLAACLSETPRAGAVACSSRTACVGAAGVRERVPAHATDRAVGTAGRRARAARGESARVRDLAPSSRHPREMRHLLRAGSLAPCPSPRRKRRQRLPRLGRPAAGRRPGPAAVARGRAGGPAARRTPRAWRRRPPPTSPVPSIGFAALAPGPQVPAAPISPPATPPKPRSCAEAPRCPPAGRRSSRRGCGRR